MQTLIIFYVWNIFLALVLLKINNSRIRTLQIKAQGLKEETNVLYEQNENEIKNRLTLQEKIKRYHRLQEIITEINRNLDLEAMADSLVSIVFSLLANNQGTCILYLADKENPGKLNLYKTKKEDKKLIIKCKEGNLLDYWVLRHTSPLLIEDIKRDFRFDLSIISQQDERAVSSLISSPLMSEHRFLGILRLDHPSPNFYMQDDLRLLVKVSELGAVALENCELFQKTQDLAIHDELTQLYTKGYFLQRLKEECKRNLRQNRGLSLFMIDIDYFKNYNDKFGHTAGDLVLKALVGTILQTLKDYSPIVSRFGGEEFCVSLSRIDKKEAYQIAERLRQNIQALEIPLRKQKTAVTVSIGVASLPDDTLDEDDLILKADKAMYEAKQKGRNRVFVYK